MAELKLTAIYEKAEEGGYVGCVAELPGANTQDETLEEVWENLKEAVSLPLECYREEAEKNLTDSSMKEDLILQAAWNEASGFDSLSGKRGYIFIREGGSRAIYKNSFT